MTITRRITTASLAALLSAALFLITATPAQGQSLSDQATNGASLVVTPSLIVEPFRDLLFPDVFSGSGIVENSQSAQSTIESDPGNELEISVSVPSQLTNNGSAIPLTYGAESGLVTACDTDGDGVVNDILFDPTAAAPQVPSCIYGDGSNRLLSIGAGTGTSGDLRSVSADVGNVPAGTYSGTITWDVVFVSS